MSLHRLTQLQMRVPDLSAVIEYYRNFGLSETSPGVLASSHGGDQLRLAAGNRREVISLGVGVDDQDDLDRIAQSITRYSSSVERGEDEVRAVDPGTGVLVRAHIAPRIVQPAEPPIETNGLGRIDRRDARSQALSRTDPVQPSKLGHVVFGSPQPEASRAFFEHGLGFALSDEIKGTAAFLRCSSDHHNLLIRPGPFSFLHHTAWEVADVDEVGRGALNVLHEHPERHVWGLGRHHIGSNFFWYLKDPAGNFTEYYSDMDCVTDEEWTPEVFEGMHAAYNWGPARPLAMSIPDDVAAVMATTHAGG
jgi:catechol-2,3-dioxygenase